MTLDRFRNRKAEKGTGIVIPLWKVMTIGGSIERFKGLQTITSYAVGNDRFEKLMFVTRENREGSWVDSSFITVTTAQAEPWLEALDAGERLGSKLSNTPAESWSLPQSLGEPSDDTSNIRIELQALKGRLELCAIRTVVGGGSLNNWERLKCGPRDCAGLIDITLKAYDLIIPPKPPTSLYDEPLDF